MNLTEVIEQFKDPTTPPGTLSATLMWLAAEYAYKNEEYKLLKIKKAQAWEEYRSSCKSDKQANAKWDATESGQLEISLHASLRTIEKLMSAIKSHLRTKETEARNQF